MAEPKLKENKVESQYFPHENVERLWFQGRVKQAEEDLEQLEFDSAIREWSASRSRVETEILRRQESLLYASQTRDMHRPESRRSLSARESRPESSFSPYVDPDSQRPSSGNPRGSTRPRMVHRDELDDFDADDDTHETENEATSSQPPAAARSLSLPALKNFSESKIESIKTCRTIRETFAKRGIALSTGALEGGMMLPEDTHPTECRSALPQHSSGLVENAFKPPKEKKSKGKKKTKKGKTKKSKKKK